MKSSMRAPAATSGRRSPATNGRPAAVPPRWPRNAPPPALVDVRRGLVVESRHRGAIVQVGADLTVERALGDPDTVVTLRSAVKPFTLIALVESGAADAFHLTLPELAVMAGSHSGEDMHVRTLQAVFRRASLSQTLLACGNMAPLDALTATRLARDGESPGPIRHMCSGFHAASILLSRHAGWPLEDYWRPDHPSQVLAREAVARAFSIPTDGLAIAVDACGLATYAFPLVEVARAYALLADPAGVAADVARRGVAPALTRIRDAMLAAPEMVGGSRDRLDTALAVVGAGRLVVKGGAEGLRAVALLAGALGAHAPAAGLALKIEDGGDQRGSHVATVEAMRQLGVLDERALGQLSAYAHPVMRDPRGEVVGDVVAGFELAPISELA
ncbi:MAG: asparaginase [Candidatus Limnocylindrales bacterium]